MAAGPAKANAGVKIRATPITVARAIQLDRVKTFLRNTARRSRTIAARASGPTIGRAGRINRLQRLLLASGFESSASTRATLVAATVSARNTRKGRGCYD